MKNYTKRYIIAIDPSGNWHEGKGTTGWCVYDALDDRINRCGEISAGAYDCMEAYWEAHLHLLFELWNKYGIENVAVVIEDYLLYANKAKEQSNSRMETPQLIGVLKHFCWAQYIPYSLQTASEVKERWKNEILSYKRIIQKHGRGFKLPHKNTELSRHTLDSIRHAVHYATFRNTQLPRNIRI